MYSALCAAGILQIFYNLTYSNFQGDEANVLKSASVGFAEMATFLGDQVKAPGQYVIAYLVSILSNRNAGSEIYFRLPFAIAAAASVVIFALLCSKIFKGNTKFTALTLFICSGLLLGLSRIVQYQSFIILFSVLSAFFLIRYNETKHKFDLVSIALCTSLGLFFHYDVLSVTIPILLFLGIRKNYKQVITIAIANLAAGLLFFMPILLNNNLWNTISYLFNKRVASSEQYDSVFYSWLLLKIYHPALYLASLTSGVILAMFRNIKTKYIYLMATSIVILLGSIFIRYFEISPHRRFTALSLLLFGIFFAIETYQLTKKNRTNESDMEIFIFIWFMTSFAFYFLVMNKPLTHIYNVIAPASIYAAYGFEKYLKQKALSMLTALILISTASFNYSAFLSSAPEYPWNSKNYLFGKMDSSIADSNNVDGIFGFPYQRHWNEITAELKTLSEDSAIINYQSNEKSKITEYYMKGFILNNSKPYYFIHIKNPQSLDETEPTEGVMIKDSADYTIYLISY